MGVVIEGYCCALMIPAPFLFLRFLGKQELELAAFECQRRRLAIAKLVSHQF
jgi:hypothetical protein